MRVLLSEMPPIVRDIFAHAIVQHPDLTLMPDEPWSGSIDAGPDVVILGTATPAGEEPLMLLEEWPRALVIAVTIVAGYVTVYELRPHVTDLGQVSPAELVRFIRGAPQ